jgi:hypothetical protein
MKTGMKTQRAIAHFAARRIAGRALRRAGILRFLPSGFVAALLAEGLLLAWQELRKRPDLRQTLWRMLATGAKARLPVRARPPG